MRISRIVCGTAVVLLGAASVLAQDRKPIPRGEMDKYVISAKAGVVNLVDGDVRVTRARPFAIPEMLISGDELQRSDTVKTGTSGRTEILLNPGCYLRVGTESEFVFLFDNVTSEQLKLVRGSAVLEASAIDGAIVVETPKARFEITRAGLYRFDVSPDGKADVSVRKGRVLVGDTKIKEGKHALVDGGTAAIAKLNKQDADVLDDWSKDRSKALIAANSRLSNAGMSRTLGISFMRNSWIYDPFCRCYTFLPLVGGFSSPYGWNYSVCNPYGGFSYYYPRNNNYGDRSAGRTGDSRSGGSNGSGSGGRAVGGGPVGGGSRPGGGGAVSPPSYRPPSMGGGASDRGSARETAGPRRSRP